MFSQLFILNYKGDTIIFKEYRHDLNRNTPDLFFRHLLSLKSDVEPCFNLEGINYIYIKKREMYFVFTTMSLVSPSLAFELLNRISKIIQDYTASLTEEAIRFNFTLIYELLDEIMDFGHPQSTSTETLKAFVFTPPHTIQLNQQDSIIDNLINTATKKTVPQKTAIRPIHQPSQIETQADSNEIYVDLWEHITILLASNGNVIRNEISGSIVMKSYLKGNPVVSMGFNQVLKIGSHHRAAGHTGVIVDDCNFHECAPEGIKDETNVMTFKPPQGEFTLFKYRISQSTYLPFMVNTHIETPSKSKMDIVIRLRSNFSAHVHSNTIIITIPLPKSTLSCQSTTTSALNAEYKGNEKILQWTIKRMNGSAEHVLRASLTVDSSSSEISNRKETGPISLDFDIPNFNCSNIQIKAMTIQGRVPPIRWVRYITETKSYVCRT
ncbi:hypothetical protein DFA_11685 [Cavenderia fasciculata]|uniref:MHD domain-containing protein n=1 Tax=Cavenderia fasciculata TaxID=261658 RepID=F4QDX7_CACFS|nr:uncharacterized protein DFA_11685 [Cavenderia fasciculata]EGG13924.1 hypothetical protein DFA_11685 [Cavenderia fasciculata]|eukprot:XP_004350632.1 hypothetical protein DFA_11685 [Cavenderia fasciculata]